MLRHVKSTETAASAFQRAFGDPEWNGRIGDGAGGRPRNIQDDRAPPRVFILRGFPFASRRGRSGRYLMAPE